MSPTVTVNPHRWIVFSALCAVYTTFGIAVTAMAPMLPLVRQSLGVSRGAMGFALGAWALIYIATAPLAGRVIDRFDLGWSVALGGLSVTGSLLLRSIAQGVGTLWLAVAFFGVFGPLISASSPALLARWFPDQREQRRGVGLSAVAPAVGGTLIIAITNPVLLPWLDGWREVLRFEAGLAGFATILWIVVWQAVEPPSRPVTTAATRQTNTIGYLLGSSQVRLVLALAFVVFFINHALSPWMPSVLEELGQMTPTTASSWVAAAGLLGIPVTALLPRLGHGSRLFPLVAVVLTLSAFALALIAFAPTPVMGFATVLSAVRAALVPIAILTLLAADRVTATNAGVATGLWFSVAEVGGVTGPLTVGIVADSAFGYRGALSSVMMICLIGVGICSWGRRATNHGTVEVSA